MRDQLRKVFPDYQSPRIARVQPVSQVGLTIEGGIGEQLFVDVRREAIKWIAKRAGRELPAHALDGSSFELEEIGAQRTAAVAMENPVLWAARLDDADKEIARRVWTTELGIAKVEDKVLFGCRLICVSMGENPEYLPSLPGIVRQVVKLGKSVSDGRVLSEKAWRVDTPADVEAFLTLLRNPRRRCPIYVISDYEDGQLGDADANWLASSALGTCHVVSLSSTASYGLTHALGKLFSVYGGAVRTYRPGFDQLLDDPGMHPLAMSDTILNWADGGASGFTRFLFRQTLRASVANRQKFEQELPTFTAIQNIARRQQRNLAANEALSDAELLMLAEEEVKGLQFQLQEEKSTSSSLLQDADEERKLLEEDRDQAQREVRALRARIEYLENSLVSSGSKPEVEIPKSLDELEQWAQRYLSGAIVLHSRALRASRKSEFEHPEVVYRSLLVLRDYYVPMRRSGGGDHREKYEKALAELGLEDSQTFSAERAGEFGDTYLIKYEGRQRELNRHLKGSNSRDPRHGFRLYYFWDEDSRQVIVGWLPTHLTNRAS